MNPAQCHLLEETEHCSVILYPDGTLGILLSPQQAAQLFDLANKAYRIAQSMHGHPKSAGILDLCRPIMRMEGATDEAHHRHKLAQTDSIDLRLALVDLHEANRHLRNFTRGLPPQD